MKYVDFKKFTDENGAMPIYLFEGEEAYFREKGEALLKSRFLQETTLDFATFEGNKLKGNSMAVAVTEAWRGELCQIAVTDEKGSIAQSRIVDPSFHNWFGLAMALRNEEISNFPICNKSFNLSYCGHDL